MYVPTSSSNFVVDDPQKRLIVSDVVLFSRGVSHVHIARTHLAIPEMSKQDKATTERNAKTLRELVKRPENKVCADCKRNGAVLSSSPDFDSWLMPFLYNRQTHDGHRGTCERAIDQSCMERGR